MSVNWLRAGWTLLASLALILSAIAFSRSGPGMALSRLLAPGIVPFVSFAVAILLGVLAWTTRPHPVLLASGLVLLHLPGVLSQSALDWGRLLWGTPVLPDPMVSPWETTALALGTATVFCAAWLVARWEALITVRVRGIDRADSARYLGNSFAAGAGVVVGAVSITSIALMVAFFLSAQSEWAFSVIPWPVALSGLAAVATVSVVVYILRFRWME